MPRKNLMPFRTKIGEHGTLYLYRLAYCDVSDRDIDGVSRMWAYDAEHAEERFFDAPDADGWKILGRPTRVRHTRETLDRPETAHCEWS